MLQSPKYNQYSDGHDVHTDKHHLQDNRGYHIPLWKMHNVNLHGWGIVSGLEVNLTGDGSALIVQSGMAVDQTGQLIVLAFRGAVTKDKPEKEGHLTASPLTLVLDEGEISPGQEYVVTIAHVEVPISLANDDPKQIEMTAWLRLQAVGSVDELHSGVTLATVILADGSSKILTAKGRRHISQSVGTVHIKAAQAKDGQIKDIDTVGFFGTEIDDNGAVSTVLRTDIVYSRGFLGVSDARLKTKVSPLTNVLARLERIRGVSFEWQDGSAASHFVPQRPQIGVIAQEVEQIFPEFVAATGADAYKGVDYGKLSAVLLEGVKELKAANDTLQRENRALAERLSVLEAHFFAGAAA